MFCWDFSFLSGPDNKFMQKFVFLLHKKPLKIKEFGWSNKIPIKNNQRNDILVLKEYSGIIICWEKADFWNWKIENLLK
jgi:hypothetical protein